MSYVTRETVTVTTDTNGDVTGYSDAVTGRILQVRYVKTDFADGSTITLTSEATGETIWTEANVNASATRAPRQATHSTAGAAALYAGAGQAVNDHIALASDRVKIVVSSGGSVKTGVFHILIG